LGAESLCESLGESLGEALRVHGKKSFSVFCEFTRLDEQRTEKWNQPREIF
jgi:hypothetical protein